jgi:hypothetical protein
MSNKTQLQTNNTALDGYIARINAAKDVAASLPEAGGSGGGGVETCTVVVSLDELFCAEDATAVISTTRYADSRFIADYARLKMDSDHNTVTFTNVVCGSVLSVLTEYTPMLLHANSCLLLTESHCVLVIEVQVPPNETDTVILELT